MTSQEKQSTHPTSDSDRLPIPWKMIATSVYVFILGLPLCIYLIGIPLVVCQFLALRGNRRAAKINAVLFLLLLPVEALQFYYLYVMSPNITGLYNTGPLPFFVIVITFPLNVLTAIMMFKWADAIQVHREQQERNKDRVITEEREWQSTKDGHSFRARYLSADDEFVVLKRSDGKIAKLSQPKLKPSDRSYVDGLKRESGEWAQAKN